jgi:hypothetical protein
MPNPVLAKLRAANRAYRTVLNSDRTGDYRIAASQLDALTHNLMTTQRGLSRSLNNKDAQVIQNMSRLASRSGRAANRSVAAAQSQDTRRYGAAMGGAAYQSLDRARVGAAGVGRTGRAGAAAGLMLGKAGSEAMGIQGSAAREAASSADYALSNALTYRAKDDAKLMADKNLQLQAAVQAEKDRLQQHQWDVEAAQQQHEDQMAYLRMQYRLSNGGSGGTGSAGFSSAASYAQDAIAKQVPVMVTNTDGTQTPKLNADGTPMMQPALDATAQANLIGELTQQYNLGPKESAHLRDMVLAGSGNSESAPDSGAQAHITALAAQARANQESGVWGDLPDENIMTILGITMNGDGTAIINGQLFSEEYAQNAIAYFKLKLGTSASSPSGASGGGQKGR